MLPARPALAAARPWTLPATASLNPDTAWATLSAEREVVCAPTADNKTPQPPNTLRLVCVSDTHARHDELPSPLPNGDVLIHAGDFSSMGEAGQIEDFIQWMDSQPHKHKVVIAGNHDLSLDPVSYPTTRKTIARGRLPEVCPSDALITKLKSVCHYLEDTSISLDGVVFYGSPWTPTFYNWGFNKDRGPPLAQHWTKIPTETDVLITHGPPVGYGDLCVGGNTHAGCVDLLREIETRVQPHVHVFGHIHEGYGAWRSAHPCPSTTFVNASSCTLRYIASNPPIIIDVPVPSVATAETSS
eukprot:m.16144 g.16144  ORF g.16144 m.16144 type:complete len:300 (-) comp3356_c0_seq2:90-989(-)